MRPFYNSFTPDAQTVRPYVWGISEAFPTMFFHKDSSSADKIQLADHFKLMMRYLCASSKKIEAMPRITPTHRLVALKCDE